MNGHARQDPSTTGHWYHVAPTGARDSIAVHGLDHTRGDSAYGGLAGFLPGNYLFGSETAAWAYAAIRETEDRDNYGPHGGAYDVYLVTGPILGLASDPFRDDESGLGVTSVFTLSPIPASQITLLTAI